MQDERPALPLPAVAALGLVMVGWLVWFFAGHLKVYGLSQTARIEVDSLAHQVQPPVDGVVEKNRLELGMAVVKDDVLLVLDSTAERLQLAQESTRLRGLKEQLSMLRLELNAQQAAQQSQTQAVGVATRVAQARGQVARTASEQAVSENDIMQQLRTNALASGLEALKSANEVRRQQGEALAASLEASRIAVSGQTDLRDRAVQVARLEHEVASLDSDINLTTTTLDRLQFEIDRRTLRASVSGLVADLTPLTTGSTVSSGQKLAVIVPEGSNRVVAKFLPSEAVGRVLPGQLAVMRLDAYPWTEYGVLSARVLQVAHEPQDGMIRVELGSSEKSPALPLTHGLTGTVEVSLEEVAPFRLLLRAAGQMLMAPPGASSTTQSSPPSANLP